MDLLDESFFCQYCAYKIRSSSLGSSKRLLVSREETIAHHLKRESILFAIKPAWTIRKAWIKTLEVIGRTDDYDAFVA
jgi:hypothetical protein